MNRFSPTSPHDPYTPIKTHTVDVPSDEIGDALNCLRDEGAAIVAVMPLSFDRDVPVVALFRVAYNHNRSLGDWA